MTRRDLLSRREIILKIKKCGFWNFSEDIPLLSIGSHPTSNPKRVEEEIRVFNIWKRFNPKIPFSNLRYRDRGVFFVDVNCFSLFDAPCGKHKKISVSIICPPRYPHSFPRLAENPRSFYDSLFRETVTRYTRNAVYLCIPAIERIWWFKNVPYAGIAHFLNIFLIWFSVTSKVKKLRREYFYERRSIVV
ncbi:MAG: hypothetical protein Q6363_005090 [Candidatus Njordarchaeota archaeon]